MSATKFAIVTGSNSGLGLHLTKSLYSSGIYSTIVMACRNEQKAQWAIEEVKRHRNSAHNEQIASSPASLEFIQLDLTSRTSVIRFVEQFKALCPAGSLQLLVNNAGIMAHPYELTTEGVEIHFASNHLGHFQLTNLLIDEERFAENSRILVVTSGYYEKCRTLMTLDALKSPAPQMSPTEYYSHSKLANCLHSIELGRRLEAAQRPVKVVAIRPGFVSGTQLGRHTNAILRLLATPLIWLVSKNLDQGISTMLHCIQCADSELKNGALYYEKGIIEYNEVAASDENGKKLWEISETLLNA